MCAAFYSSEGGSNLVCNNPSIVVDIGSHSTKIGWAGDDYPRAYFRSNIAVRRRRRTNNGGGSTVDEDSMDIDSNNENDNNTNISNGQKGRIICDENNISYDYYTRCIVKHDKSTNTYDDGDYEPASAVDSSYGTGLLYQSINSNYTNNEDQLLNTNDNDSNSFIPDWYDLLKTYINHAYETSLQGCTPTDHPIIISERAYNIPPIRQMMTECLFEELQAPAIFLAKDAVLQCYGVGKTSGMSIDIGYSGTTVAPVYDGYVETVGVQRSPIGLQAVDELILQQLDRLYNDTKRKGSSSNSSSTKNSSSSSIMPLYQLRTKGMERKSSIHTAARMYMAQDCREVGAGIAINMTQFESSTGTGSGGTNGPANSTSATASAPPKPTFHAPKIPYELPDGTIVDVSSVDRFRSADYLFGLNLQNSILPLSSSSSSSQQSTRTTVEKRRLELYERTKSNLLNYCSSTSAAVTSYNNWKLFRGQHQTTTKDSTSSNINSLQLHQQDAAAAVGIVTRQQKDALQQQKAGDNAQYLSSIKLYEKYVNWHRSCLADIQTLALEQLTHNTIATMVCDAAYKCDREQLVTLLGTVVVGGGGSTIGPTEQAVPDLLKDSIEKQIHTHTPGWRIKLLTPTSNSERTVLPWLGGSILGSLNTFPTMYITKQEYDEWGSAIVNRKCP